MLLPGVFCTLATPRVVTQKVVTYYFYILLIEKLEKTCWGFFNRFPFNFWDWGSSIALFQSVQKNEFFKIIKVVEGNIYHVSYFLKA